MPNNPLDLGHRDERALEEALLARLRGIRRIDVLTIADQVRAGRYGGITQGEQWLAGLDRSTAAAARAEAALLRRGWLQGVSEIGDRAKELRGETDAFVGRWTDQRVHSFLATFEADTRRNVARMARNAGARFDRTHNLTLVQRLAERLKARLGLTSRQARQIEAYEREAAKAELPDSVIEREVQRRAQIALEARARFAAEREAVETLNFGRAAAWAEARRRGLVGRLEKHWRDQGDDRVRATHAEQTREGWIPWGRAYSVFGVQHPPAPEHGCRCYESIREVAA